MAIDLQISEDGELLVNAAGDLATCWGDEQLAQEVLVRLKTQKGDYLLAPEMGASLERFIGSPNEASTHLSIEAAVRAELERGGLVSGSTVDVIPIGANEILIVVEFPSYSDDDRIIQVSAGLDLRTGLVYARADTRES
jgi:hypothetical protein